MSKVKYLTTEAEVNEAKRRHARAKANYERMKLAKKNRRTWAEAKARRARKADPNHNRPKPLPNHDARPWINFLNDWATDMGGKAKL